MESVECDCSSDDTCLVMQSVVCFIYTVPPSVFSRVDMFHAITPTRSNPGCQLHVEDVSHFIYLHICVVLVAMASYIVKLDDNLFCTS